MNGYQIVNIYCEPNITELIKYIMEMDIMVNILINSNFNIRYKLFKPEAESVMQNVIFVK